ncbi:MAG: guanylate kinase [Lentisphaeria bacterium]|nr:guanylate kinase [Lentisphaeria bacterium]
MLKVAPGFVIVMSGPSGVGKSTLLKPLLTESENLEFSVSCTTRAPREGEVDGAHYHFIDKPTFEAKIKAEEFIEYANVHGNYYGTLISSIEERVLAGFDVILDIDVQGAMQLKAKLADFVDGNGFCLKDVVRYLFIAPPSFEILSKRLTERGTESADSLAHRLGNAKQEIEARFNYDYIVTNDNLEVARDELRAIMLSLSCCASILKYSTQG